jgi:hypothetical protein
MTPNIKTFLITVLFFTPGFLFSQEIITDRPDRTESVETVGKNKFQIETGLEYSLLKVKGFNEAEAPTEFNFKSLTLPTTLLRYGILRNLELRLGFDFDRETISSDDNVEYNNSGGLSLNPLSLGAKVEFAKGSGIVPDFSVIAGVKLPNIGDELKQVKHFIPELVLTFSNEINDKLGVGYNLGVEWNDDMEEKEFFYSASLGIEISPRVGAFAEIYGNIPKKDGINNQNIDGGFTYLIKSNVQVDIYGGFGLTEESNDFMFGTGLSLKF